MLVVAADAYMCCMYAGRPASPSRVPLSPAQPRPISSICMYVYTYIYIKRERERDRNIWKYMDGYIGILVWIRHAPRQHAPYTIHHTPRHIMLYTMTRTHTHTHCKHITKIICIHMHDCVCIYFSRLARCGAPMFGIFYVEKGVLTCTRAHVLKDRCSRAGENTIS